METVQPIIDSFPLINDYPMFNIEEYVKTKPSIIPLNDDIYPNEEEAFAESIRQIHEEITTKDPIQMVGTSEERPRSKTQRVSTHTRLLSNKDTVIKKELIRIKKRNAKAISIRKKLYQSAHFTNRADVRNETNNQLKKIEEEDNAIIIKKQSVKSKTDRYAKLYKKEYFTRPATSSIVWNHSPPKESKIVKVPIKANVFDAHILDDHNACQQMMRTLLMRRMPIIYKKVGRSQSVSLNILLNSRVVHAVNTRMLSRINSITRLKASTSMVSKCSQSSNAFFKVVSIHKKCI